RPRRPAGPLRAPGRRQGRRARGDHGLRRGLLPGARDRPAAHRGRGDRHRPAHDAALRSAVDPRRDPLPPDAPRARLGTELATQAPGPGFEWYVAWRPLRDPQRRSYRTLVFGLGALGLAALCLLVVYLAPHLPYLRYGVHPRAPGEWLESRPA